LRAADLCLEVGISEQIFHCLKRELVLLRLSSPLTSDHIVEAIQADEHKLFFVRVPHFDLPDEYYPLEGKDPD